MSSATPIFDLLVAELGRRRPDAAAQNPVTEPDPGKSRPGAGRQQAGQDGEPAGREVVGREQSDRPVAGEPAQRGPSLFEPAPAAELPETGGAAPGTQPG
ncbi:MAG TPA: hypothetical protein VGL64_04645 [Amycolatopsis sp.]|jgi:hypothetical protein